MKNWMIIWTMINGGIVGLYSIPLFVWQVRVLKGGRMANPDGSADDWHLHESYYGIALADVFLACPVSIATGIVAFLWPRLGAFFLAIVGFWFFWVNISTTSTSLRFRKPELTAAWWITFPSGALIGLSSIIPGIIALAAGS